ncbi:cytochrome c-type biogenesis protein [Uliginosibacterium paludis]|uniref:Cytochrome c-type biogenesis protein n=1 Tax=Uliginosibacterium paludis TaxID=1615952 RepID=A0ABV2CPC7_9RHOO
MCAGLLGVAGAAGSDAALDARVMKISEELRCLVCQNQSIAESNADLAQDLRREVREMLAAGKTEADVREFMVERYGDFVLYDPPVKRSTLLLWIGPGLAAVIALGGLWWQLARRRRTRAGDEADAPDEAALAQARALLDAKDEQ